MHRWRRAAGFSVTLLCFVLAGHVTRAQTPAKQAQASKPGTESSEKKGPIVDEEDVVVKPRGGGMGAEGKPIEGYGFYWNQHRTVLKKGKAKFFRCDLYDHLDKLQASRAGNGDFENAVEVRFDLDGVVFDVKQNEQYQFVWTLPPGTKPCKIKGKKDCEADGVPPELMNGKKTGTIKAWFAADPNSPVDVTMALMHGKNCP